MALSSRLTDSSPPRIYSLSLHDALPICAAVLAREGRRRAAGRDRSPDVLGRRIGAGGRVAGRRLLRRGIRRAPRGEVDRKSTRLNSSHSQISYAVFCLKKKNTRVTISGS